MLSVPSTSSASTNGHRLGASPLWVSCLCVEEIDAGYDDSISTHNLVNNSIELLWRQEDNEEAHAFWQPTVGIQPRHPEDR